MRIRNTEKLIERAVEHAKADRFIQGFSYLKRVRSSDESVRAEVGEIKGCAIGCLATPVGRVKRTLARFGNEMTYYDAENILGRNFGICPGLVEIAEDIFEKLDSTRAKRFPERFARALVEESKVTDDDLAQWSERNNIEVCTDTSVVAEKLLRWLRSRPVAA